MTPFGRADGSNAMVLVVKEKKRKIHVNNISSAQIIDESEKEECFENSKQTTNI